MLTTPFAGASRRQIRVASPVEPSGASWLLNCFLELGVMVGHKPVVDRVWRGSNPPLSPNHIWRTKGDSLFELNPKAASLMKFLPALGQRETFRFRDDVGVEYVQDFPPRDPATAPVILMVRDPRDAMYSMFRRLSADLSFAEFVRFPNPQTLLSRPAQWSLFVASWLSGTNVHVVRFEDYKRDAEATLRSALEAVGLRFADDAIAEALRRSSFERAALAERTFRARFPGDHRVANRAGRVGEGRGHPDVLPLIQEIESAAAHELMRLGYQRDAGDRRGTLATSRVNARLLAFFDNVRMPPELVATPPTLAEAEPALFALLAFAHRLDDDLIRRAALPPAEVRVLHDSLAEIARNYAAWLGERLASGRTRYADGSAYFFEHLRLMTRNSVTRVGGERAAGPDLPASPG